MSPSSRLIVYYITDAGDVVCDAIWLDIKDECENRLSVRANRAEYEPDSDAVITVTGDPGTFVGVLAVDKAVYLLNDEHKLTAQKMFQRMDKFDLGCGPGGGRNAKEVFEDVGLLVITNAGLETEKRESYGCNAVAAARKKRSLLSDAEEYTGVLRNYCEEGQIRTRTAPLSGIDVDIYCEEQAVEGIFEEVLPLQDPRVIAFIDCCVNALLIATDNRGRLGVFEDGWTDAENIIEDESELQVRSDFPETWIFADEFLDDNGQMILPVTVPSSLTQWIVQAVGVSRDTGMCVAEPFELLAFKEFFIQLSLPYSVIKGEQIEIRAAVFNYGEHDLIVRAYLYGVDDICSEAKPGERSERKEFIVKAKEATSITFPVIPMSVGEFPIRISAFSPAGGDIVEKILKVEPAGVERSFVHSVFLDPSGLMRNEVQEVNNGENNHNHHDFASNDYVDIQNQNQHNVLDLRMPPDVVPGSAECRVNIVGNLMGPTVSAVIGDNLQGLLRQPTGCGEQTLIYTAPSIYVLLYLTATDKVTPDIEKKAHDYIRAGYARELTYYKNNPGCFSVWTHKPCSTWLTAFAMKIFCQASEFVVVDPKVICGATNWLLTMQNDDGSIRENFLVYHKEMTGGVHADATFTAYVLISLLECDCNTAEMSTAILNSVLYLERAIDVADRPYAVAIITYALALANSEKKHEANEKLRAMSTYDEATNSRHWTTDAASFGDGNKPYWYTRNPSAIGVETTGYALLAQVELGDITYSNAIVVWLTSQRNAQGGFVSTQDTVIALQALVSYASEAGRSSDLDMECEVTSEADPGYREVILLNDEGATMQHIREAPTDGKLYVDTTGSGIGNLQVEVRYNSQATYAETCSFNITVIAAEPRLGRIDEVPVEHENERIDLDVIDRSRVGRDVDRVQRAAARQDNSDYIIHMTVSVRFKKPGGTGMAIVDVGLFSGFEPIKKGLEKLTNDVVSPVQRYEVNKRSIIFYVDEITDQNNVVIEFDIKRVYNVGQIQPVAIKVYDYYSPDTQCTKFYHAGEGSALLNTLCVGDLCVCAEGKCAKCLDEPGVKLEKKNELVIKACRDMDYAFKVLVVDVKSENGFDLITAVIEVLAKRGTYHLVTFSPDFL
uniref:C3 and PZP-like alpha-2-macroglobulin domain-containing protein 8-like n=1 Tax=Saccoglossus kowalevskii TaxID=10224 RepID=A0ABM0LZI1_SACKO|nr:PREDICTED: C3 and PZP-like alpha-2-macroglobulin domain-containing protein 8-like [Saccoglossus kowalevskii]